MYIVIHTLNTRHTFHKYEVNVNLISVCSDIHVEIFASVSAVIMLICARVRNVLIFHH